MSPLFNAVALFTMMHVCVWWATNAQFIEGWDKANAFFLSLGLSVPITLLAFFSSKYAYEALDQQAWSVRFLGFGISYLVFPLLTWVFLHETMFTWKTMVCIFLSFLIIYIQIRC